MAQPGGSQDTLAVPAKQLHQGDQAGLNEDLVRILRENLLQQERPRRPRERKSPSSMSPRLSPTTLSPRNSPRLLRRMLINNNVHKQRRFTVAHTW
ncbi:cAMP-specific 3',5'-cyclic phosphodiesterase 4D-like isoform X1 [Tachysurus ichikawai]